MRPFQPEPYFDATFREARFDRFYTDFFNVRMKETLKGVNRLHYDCTLTCISEESIDNPCLEQCSSVYDHFFNHVEGLLQGKLASYPKCLQTCKEGLPMAECCDKCIEETVERLKEIDPKKEFARFLEFSEWKANTQQ